MSEKEIFDSTEVAQTNKGVIGSQDANGHTVNNNYEDPSKFIFETLLNHAQTKEANKSLPSNVFPDDDQSSSDDSVEIVGVRMANLALENDAVKNKVVVTGSDVDVLIDDTDAVNAGVVVQTEATAKISIGRDEDNADITLARVHDLSENLASVSNGTSTSLKKDEQYSDNVIPFGSEQSSISTAIGQNECHYGYGKGVSFGRGSRIDFSNTVARSSIGYYSNQNTENGFHREHKLVSNPQPVYTEVETFTKYNVFLLSNRVIDVTGFNDVMFFTFTTLERCAVQKNAIDGFLGRISAAKTIQFAMESFESCDAFFEHLQANNFLVTFLKHVTEISFRDYVTPKSLKLIASVCGNQLTSVGIRNCFLPGDDNLSMAYNQSNGIRRNFYAVRDILNILKKFQALKSLTIDLRLTDVVAYESTVNTIGEVGGFSRLNKLVVFTNGSPNGSSIGQCNGIITGKLLDQNGRADFIVDTEHSHLEDHLRGVGFRVTNQIEQHPVSGSHLRVQHYRVWELENDRRIHYHVCMHKDGLVQHRENCDKYPDNKGYPKV